MKRKTKQFPSSSRFCFCLLFLTINNRNRRTGEVKALTQSVFLVLSIGEMSKLRVVAEHDKCRWVDSHLAGEKNLKTAVVEFRSRVHVLGILNDFIENRCRNTAAARFISLFHRGQNLLHSFAVFGGHEQDFGVI